MYAPLLEIAKMLKTLPVQMRLVWDIDRTGTVKIFGIDEVSKSIVMNASWNGLYASLEGEFALETSIKEVARVLRMHDANSVVSLQREHIVSRTFDQDPQGNTIVDGKGQLVPLARPCPNAIKGITLERTNPYAKNYLRAVDNRVGQYHKLNASHIRWDLVDIPLSKIEVKEIKKNMGILGEWCEFRQNGSHLQITSETPSGIGSFNFVENFGGHYNPDRTYAYNVKLLKALLPGANSISFKCIKGALGIRKHTPLGDYFFVLPAYLR